VDNLSKRYVDDFFPYLTVQGRSDHRRQVERAIKACGEIVKIEDVHSEDGSKIIERIYHHADGTKGILSATKVRAKQGLPAAA